MSKDRLLTEEAQSKFIEFPVEGYTTDREGLCKAQDAKTASMLKEELIERVREIGGNDPIAQAVIKELSDEPRIRLVERE